MAIGQCVNCFTDVNLYIYRERINTEGNKFKLIKTFGFSIYSVFSHMYKVYVSVQKVGLFEV